MGPTWVLSAPDGLHAGPMNFAIRAVICQTDKEEGHIEEVMQMRYSQLLQEWFFFS